MIFGLENNPKNIFILFITFFFILVSMMVVIINLCCCPNKENDYIELNNIEDEDINRNENENSLEGRLVFKEKFFIDSDNEEDVEEMDV